MKKFWFGVLLAGFSLTISWLLGVRSQLGVSTPNSHWVFDAYQLKIAAANAIAGPRVLVVAGSNAMFGIDSKQLESFWNIPVVNLGVNAGLGLPYILAVSRRVARPGDVILMPLEYALYLDDGKPSSQLINYVIGRDMDYWRSLSRFEQLRFSAGMSSERWVEGLRHLPDTPVTGTYGAHHLDAKGDQTHSSATDLSPENIAAVKAAKPWSYGARAANESGGWALLTKYIHWAHANNICLIAVPTALLHHAKYDTDIQEQTFYSGLAHRLQGMGIPYAGQPKDFMYPIDWFFDTDYHLQDWARTRHTANLIKVLDDNPYNYCNQ